MFVLLAHTHTDMHTHIHTYVHVHVHTYVHVHDKYVCPHFDLQYSDYIAALKGVYTLWKNTCKAQSEYWYYDSVVLYT